MKTIRAVDLFCGAGGTSTGLIDACRKLGLTLELSAINHWNIAIETHSQNHPWAHHFCADADVLNPCKTAGRGPIDLLVASPECTHHSIARGGKPRATLSGAVKMFPTPKASPSGPDYAKATRPNCGTDDLATFVAKFPTPTAMSDTGGLAMCRWGGSRARKQLRKTCTEKEINGALNPDWTEWLMGFPIGWTGLERLGTRKYR